jgi:hypothetical protein
MATPVKWYYPGPVCRTRYAELAYQHRGDHWRILDLTGGEPAEDAPGVGPQYRTRAELLADLDRYATDVFGC